MGEISFVDPLGQEVAVLTDLLQIILGISLYLRKIIICFMDLSILFCYLD